MQRLIFKKINILFLLAIFSLHFSCSKDTDILSDYVININENNNQYAVDDAFIINGHDPIVLDVLANDTFAAGQNVKIIQTSNPENGAIEISENQKIIYTPTDTSDNEDDSNTAETPNEDSSDSSSNESETSTETSETTETSESSSDDSETEEQNNQEIDTFDYVIEVEEEDGSTTTEEGTVTIEPEGNEETDNTSGTDDISSTNFVIPSNFDWSNIPANMSNASWEIFDRFELSGQEIIIPENITLIFKGGTLVNGTISFNNTIIQTEDNQRIFESINLVGTLGTEFIKPQWFGAYMNGSTDDRDYLVETLKQANNTNAKILIDGKMFIDVSATGTKSIFLNDNDWIEGTSESELIINNLRSPAFIIALADNVTFKNLNMVWDQTYSTLPIDSQTNAANQLQVENWLIANKGMSFSGADPAWSGAISFWAVFNIRGASNILLEDVSLRVPDGANAQQFCPYFMKLTTEFNENTSVTNESTDPKTQTSNVTLRRLTLDGTIMGIQGNVSNFNAETIRSHRYTDIQNSAGGDIGGNGGTWSPPPHLFYINRDGQPNDSNEVYMTDIIDYGEYVGSINVRSGGGYCNSLKLTDNITNVNVDGYASYRRDGLADMQNISNGTFKNLYAESETNIFQANHKFNTLRFVGNLDNVIFENMVLKDNSLTSTVYPLDSADGVNVTLSGVEVITTSPGCFRLRGTNNTIENSSLNLCN
ncbi:Ig-like domain-containing protein [uncultured Maribacter sp.]|uniref:Ig-like domain-containing protein n=1 Tax=uncultured Maribacter sp. TaxID=431308 RepID=UPI00260B494F|nr:Ig-like domain-containing protein [uncultured Maribacter sp.]